MITYNIELSPEEIAGLLHWHDVTADFGEVGQATGVDLIEVLGKLAAVVKDGSVTHTLACPNCQSTNLDTLEVAHCVAECSEITTNGPEYSGTTDYDRGDQVTVGVICNGCLWEYTGDDWLEQLVRAEDDGDDADA